MPRRQNLSSAAGRGASTERTTGAPPSVPRAEACAAYWPGTKVRGCPGARAERLSWPAQARDWDSQFGALRLAPLMTLCDRDCLGAEKAGSPGAETAGPDTRVGGAGASLGPRCRALPETLTAPCFGLGRCGSGNLGSSGLQGLGAPTPQRAVASDKSPSHCHLQARPWAVLPAGTEQVLGGPCLGAAVPVSAHSAQRSPGPLQLLLYT